MVKENQFKTCAKVLAAAFALSMSAGSHAALSSYSDDFQGYGGADFFTPWAGFSDNCGFPGGYSFAPPTGGPQITALANDGMGNEYLNFYANYDNGTCHSGAGPNPVENISVFIQQDFTGAEAAGGATWTFEFDYREADVPPAGSTTVGAFIRVFDGVFNLLDEQTLDTSGSSVWQTGTLSQTLDAAWVNGGIIQFGFTNGVQNFEDSGMFYDNVSWAVPVPAAVWLFGSALGLLGWLRTRRAA